MEQQRRFSWLSPKTEVRETFKYGRGVFTKEPIKKDEIIIVMGGYILTIEDENNLKGYIADKPIEISDEFSIGPVKPSDVELMPQHLLNHSCTPNVGFNGQIFMVAIRDIEPGEELCWDYAMAMNSNLNSATYFTFTCECDSTQCRNKVTEDDWKLPELQKRYNGYFQWFLQKKIDRDKK